MPKRSATKGELQQQIKELQQKLKEAQAVAKDRDRDELEDATLREELEAYQEQASQERAEQERLHKVLETAEAEIADLREDLDQANWELEECCCDTELNAPWAKESACEEMKDRHLKEMSRPHRCYICHSLQHRAYECLQQNAPSEASGRDRSR